MILELIHGLALLVALGAIYGLAARGEGARQAGWRWVHGLLFGAIGVLCIVGSTELAPGVYYDARSVVIVAAALLLGWRGAASAVLVAGGYRLLLGGQGALLGTAAIVVSALVALGWQALRGRRRLGLAQLALLQLVVSALCLALLRPLTPTAFDPLLVLTSLALQPLGLVLVVELTRIALHHERQRRILSHREALFRAAFESGAAGMVLADPTGHLERVNGRVGEILGYAPGALEGRHWTTLVHPGDRDAARSRGEAVRDGHLGRSEGVLRLLRRDGSAVVCQASVARVAGGEEGGEHILVVVEDLSEQRRRQAAYARLAVGIESIDEGVILTDPQGRIEYVNPAFERITGHDADTVQGKTPRVLRSPSTPDEVFGELWETILDGRTWRGRMENRRADGRPYRADLTISPVRDEEGAITGFVGVQRDVTQEMELERRLQQAQKMDAIGRLAGGVAHDFSNLLTAISGYAQLVLGRLERGDPLRERVQPILDAAHRAEDLTRHLLSFSRARPAQTRLVDLGAAVRGLRRLLDRLVGEDVRITLRVEDGVHVVEGDPSRIDQVVLNLAVNAREAMPRGGTLAITLRARPGEVELVVADDGVGMDQATRDHLFEPFFTTKADGTGLGLATVYGAVEEMGGQIDVDSAPGQGTRFTIRLPTVEGATLGTAAETVEGEEPPGGTERILVVEDDDATRRFVCEALRSGGYDVEGAASATDALRWVDAAGVPDLVVSDVVMPDGSGPTLLAELRRLHGEVPAVWMSGHDSERLREHGLDPEDRTAPILHKPLGLRHLLRFVRAALDAGGLVEAGGRPGPKR